MILLDAGGCEEDEKEEREYDSAHHHLFRKGNEPAKEHYGEMAISVPP
jgi:hypothetical protein